MCPEDGRDGIRLLEPIFEEVPDIALIQLGQLMEFQTRHAPLPGFHLGHRRAGNPEGSCGLHLRDVAGLPRAAKASSEFKLGDRHLGASVGVDRAIPLSAEPVGIDRLVAQEHRAPGASEKIANPTYAGNICLVMWYLRTSMNPR